MKRLCVLICSLMLVFGMAGFGQASTTTAIVDLDPDITVPFQGNPYFVGFEFRTESEILVTHLGAFHLFGDDEDPSSSTQIGIYNKSNGLLVVSGDLSTINDDEDYFDFVELDVPVSLDANTSYFIVSDINDNFFTYDWNSDWYVANINFQGSVYMDGMDILEDDYKNPTVGGAVYPIQDPPYDAYFGPNFKFTAVPVPSAVWLLGSGLFGLIGLRKRYQKKS